MTEKHLNRRLRISVRSLFLVMTIVAVATWYWDSRPRRMAHAFITAVREQDSDTLMSLGVEIYWLPMIYDVGQNLVVTAEVRPQSMREWLRGRLFVRVQITGEDGKRDATIRVNGGVVTVLYAGVTDLKAARERQAQRKQESKREHEEYLREREAARQQRMRLKESNL